MQQELIPLSDRVRWKQALEGIRHAFGHTWESCHAMALTTGYRTHLYHCSTEAAHIVCPISERCFHGEIDILTPYGMSGFAARGTVTDFERIWMQFAREQGWVCGYVGMHPGLKPHATNGFRAHYATELYFLDLTSSESELFERLSSNRRRQINAWRACGASVCRSNQELLDFVLTHSDEFFERRSASTIYHFSAETWRHLFSSPNVIVLGATAADQIVAVSIFAASCDLGEYLFSISLPEGRRFSAPLLWEGMLELKSRGVATLNLGGGIKGQDSVAEFKRRFGAKRVPFQCLKQVYRLDRFGLLCDIAGVPSDDLSGYFPPYRVSRVTTHV
jgi:hypothetical protein